MFPPKKILVPTDFSENSDKALQQAIDIARWSKAELYLLNVGDERTVRQCGFDFCLPDEMMRQIKERIVTSGEENLRKQLSRVPDGSGVSITPYVKQGVPDELILREAQEKAVDLIVMGAVGGTASRSRRMGSIADRVAEGADCSVLVVK